MARTIAFVPSAPAKGAPLLPLDRVPQDVRNEVEEAYAVLQQNPNGRLHAEFEDAKEMAQYVTYVTAYCAQRPDGPIKFRKSPTKGMPDNAMDYTIKDIKVDAAATETAPESAVPQAPKKTTKKAA